MMHEHLGKMHTEKCIKLSRLQPVHVKGMPQHIAFSNSPAAVAKPACSLQV